MVPARMERVLRTLVMELQKDDCQITLVKNLIDQLMLYYLMMEDDVLDYEYGTTEPMIDENTQYFSYRGPFERQIMRELAAEAIKAKPRARPSGSPKSRRCASNRHHAAARGRTRLRD